MTIELAKQNKGIFSRTRKTEVATLFHLVYRISSLQSIEDFIFRNGKIMFIFNFKSGGWNSVQATCKEDAIKQIKLRFNDDHIVESSIEVPTMQVYDNLLSMFN